MGRYGVVASSVPQECPQSVDPAPGERHDSLAMAFVFGSLAVVEAAGLVAAADADQRGGVEEALETSAVARGAVQVAADLPGASWSGGDADEAASRSARWRRRSCHRLWQPGTRHPAGHDAAHAPDYLDVAVSVKLVRDEFVALGGSSR